ncbi:hypothetical protein BGZ83_001893, partial [Gryganskiella cystojenkinii]
MIPVKWSLKRRGTYNDTPSDELDPYMCTPTEQAAPVEMEETEGLLTHSTTSLGVTPGFQPLEDIDPEQGWNIVEVFSGNLPARLYLESCKTIADFDYIGFLEFSENQRLSEDQCEGQWTETLRRLLASEHVGLQRKAADLKKQWKKKTHTDDADVFWAKVKRKRQLDKGTLQVQAAVDSLWNKRIREEYEQEADDISEGTKESLAGSSSVLITPPRKTRLVEHINAPAASSSLDFHVLQQPAPTSYIPITAPAITVKDHTELGSPRPFSLPADEDRQAKAFSDQSPFRQMYIDNDNESFEDEDPVRQAQTLPNAPMNVVFDVEDFEFTAKLDKVEFGNEFTAYYNHCQTLRYDSDNLADFRVVRSPVSGRPSYIFTKGLLRCEEYTAAGSYPTADEVNEAVQLCQDAKDAYKKVPLSRSSTKDG